MKSTLGIWCMAACMAAAQTPAPQESMTLTLAQAVDLSLAPDGATKQLLAAEMVRQYDARQMQALAPLLPNVDGTFSYQNFTRNLKALGISIPAIGPYPIPDVIGPIDVYDFRGNATQTILDMSVVRRYQAAKAAVEAAKLDNSAARNQTAATVARAYVAALTAQAALDAEKANVKLAEELLALARTQKDAGTGTGIEVVRAEAQVSSERQRMIVAERDVTTTKLGVLRAIGLPLGTNLTLAEQLAYKPVDVPGAAASIELAKASRPEMGAQTQRERGAQLTNSAAKWERAPTINAYGDYGTIGTEMGHLLPTHTAGVTVRIPVFDGGRRDARRMETQSQLRQEQIKLRDTAQQVELEVRLALDGLKTAASQVDVANETLALSLKELEQAQRRYQAGVAAGLEVTDAQTRAARSREAQVAATATHRLARVDYGVAVGSLDQIVQ
jgi:outer membrane protein